MEPLELLLFVFLIAISAVMSASELALFSLSRFQLRGLKENFRSGHKQIKKLLGDPGGLLVTILVVTEVVNVWLSAIITQAVSRTPKDLPRFLTHIPIWWVDIIIGTLITTPIILFFCEITPKVVGARANRLVATAMAGTLSVVYDLARPIRFVLKAIVSLISKRFETFPTAPANPAEDPEQILKESDFLLMIEEGMKEGAIQQSELELIKNVFELDDTVVGDLFTPITQVQTLPDSTLIKAAHALMRSHRFSRIPVLSANRREVVGILYKKDLIRGKLTPELLQRPVSAVMRKPLYVSSTLRLNALFRRFKQQKMHMAVVQDSKGRLLGIVTMSDVLEALFEDLYPDERISGKLRR